jgi:hypothetical protein
MKDPPSSNKNIVREQILRLAQDDKQISVSPSAEPWLEGV